MIPMPTPHHFNQHSQVCACIENRISLYILLINFVRMRATTRSLACPRPRKIFINCFYQFWFIFIATATAVFDHINTNSIGKWNERKEEKNGRTKWKRKKKKDDPFNRKFYFRTFFALFLSFVRCFVGANRPRFKSISCMRVCVHSVLYLAQICTRTKCALCRKPNQQSNRK